VFGILRDNVFNAGTLNVVYVSGAFIKDTLKTDTSTSVDNVEARLRELGIYCRPSTHYSTEPPLPVATRPWIGSLSPSSAAAGSSPLTLSVSGGNFSAASVIVFNGADQATTLVDAATLTCSISPAAPAGERVVFVRDGTQSSNTVVFMVT
jgi:IPT/TIG domain